MPLFPPAVYMLASLPKTCMFAASVRPAPMASAILVAYLVDTVLESPRCADAGAVPAPLTPFRLGVSWPTCQHLADIEASISSSLQELFSPFGPISRIYIAYDRETGESRGFAFVNFVYRLVHSHFLTPCTHAPLL